MKRQILYILAVAFIFAAAFAGCKKDPKDEPQPPEPKTPVITITTQPVATTTVTAGGIAGSLTVAAAVTENATLSYQWYSNANATTPTTGGAAESGATGASFTIPTSLAAGTYYYFCELKATGGATAVRSNAATVTVNAPPKIKLLETMTNIFSDHGDYVYKFEYDEQNRISKISNYSNGSLRFTNPLTYSGNDLTEMGFVPENNLNISYYTFEYAKSGNTITVTGTQIRTSSGSTGVISTSTLTLNSDGLPVKEVSNDSETTFQYDSNGNVTKCLSNSRTEEIKYDDKKSPIYNCKTQKWWLQRYFQEYGIGNHNNITEYAWTKNDGYGYKNTHTYVYDSDGFPTKATVKQEYIDENIESIEWEATFTYIEK